MTDRWFPRNEQLEAYNRRKRITQLVFLGIGCLAVYLAMEFYFTPEQVSEELDRGSPTKLHLALLFGYYLLRYSSLLAGTAILVMVATRLIAAKRNQAH